MASAEASFSDDFARTARDEVNRLLLRAEEQRLRARRWIERGEQLLHESERLEARVRDLNELLGLSAQLRIDLQTSVLQGHALREAATAILLQRRGVLKPIHYRDWYELLIEHGLTAAGKDPLATFLTQIRRSPVVVSLSGARGTYQLDPHGAYEQARLEVADASREFSAIREAVESSVGASEQSEARAGSRLDKAKQNLNAVLEARTTLLQARLSGPALGVDAA